MKIDHIAIWVQDLETMKRFYEKYFEAQAGQKYTNIKKNFQSYFLSFESGARLEIMQMPGIAPRNNDLLKQIMGITHLSISVGSRRQVDALTEQLRTEGVDVVGEPRTTGDGYYESVILDPEGNRIEITI